MHKLGGANAGMGSCINRDCCIVRILYRRGRAVADGGVQHPHIW